MITPDEYPTPQRRIQRQIDVMVMGSFGGLLIAMPLVAWMDTTPADLLTWRDLLIPLSFTLGWVACLMVDLCRFCIEEYEAEKRKAAA